MHRRTLLTLIVLIAVVALSACGPKEQPFECTDEWGCATFTEGQNIKIAYVGPMTGDYSAFGIDISRGATLAVAEHPTVKGRDIELVIEDTQGSPEQGAAVANKLAADSQVVAVAGHTFSGSTIAAIPIYEEAHIVMMSPSTTLANLPELGPNVYNRVAFSDKLQGEMAADYMYNALGVRSVVGIHDGGAYGQGLVEGMAGAFEEMGGTVLGIEAVTPGETDYSAPLAAVAELNPELVYWGGYDADAAVLVSQMAGAGLQNAMFFGCDGSYGTNYIELAGPAAEGTYSTYVPIPPSEAFEEFKVAYEEEFGDPQGKLSPFSPHGHDSTAILIAAIEEVAIEHGGSVIIPRKALADTVRGTTGFGGLTGTLNCSGGDCAAASPVFMVVENGVWVEAPGQ
ncbi:MAG: branched-chain amino acid ABC transporter substrate-binding protein [Chloroflexi bacterium]|nr:branched-chain amino acid ABC transporter substrate-binding protein [Chloroflexota bacterium]